MVMLATRHPAPANTNLQQPITLTFIYIYGMWQIRNFIQMKQRVYKYLMLAYFLLTLCHFNFLPPDLTHRLATYCFCYNANADVSHHVIM